METTNEILDSASHDCPLVTQTYSTAATTGAHVPSSPTRLGKGHDASPEGAWCQALARRSALGTLPLSCIVCPPLPLRAGDRWAQRRALVSWGLRAESSVSTFEGEIVTMAQAALGT